jgi:hypothetical protein
MSINLDLVIGGTTLRELLAKQKGRGVKVPDGFSTSFILWDESTPFSYDNPTNVWFITTMQNAIQLEHSKKTGPNCTNREVVELAVKQGQKFTVHGNFIHFGN